MFSDIAYILLIFYLCHLSLIFFLCLSFFLFFFLMIRRPPRSTPLSLHDALPIFDDFARRPFNRLVGCRNYNRGNRQRIDIVTSRANYGFLDPAITFGHHIGFVGALVEPPISRVAAHQFSLDFFGVGLVEMLRRLGRLFLLFALHSLAYLGGHLAANVIRRIFAGVRDNHRDFARLDLFGCLENHLEKQWVNVVGARQQNVFLRTALAFAVDELVAILKVVVARNRFGHVIARIQRRAVQSFDQTDLV